MRRVVTMLVVLVLVLGTAGCTSQEAPTDPNFKPPDIPPGRKSGADLPKKI